MIKAQAWVGIDIGREFHWAVVVDMAQGPVALLAVLLREAERDVLYVPGLVVNRSRVVLAGESKTDRKDARVIARMPALSAFLRKPGAMCLLSYSTGQR